jgi:MFS family permease
MRSVRAAATITPDLVVGLARTGLAGSRGESLTAVRRRSLLVLGVGMVASLSTWFSTSAATTSLDADLGLASTTHRWMAVAVQAGFAGGALAAAAAGLPARVAPRSLAAMGACAAALANALPLLSADPGTLVASRLLVGVALALVYPPLLTAAASWTTGDHGRVLGAMIAALTLGSSLPHLVNGLGGLDWRSTLLATSSAALVGGALVVVAATDGPHLPARSEFHRRFLARIATERRLRLTCLGYLGHIWELYAGWALIGSLMIALVGDRPMARLLAFAVVGAGAAGVWVGGQVGDLAGRARTARGAMVCSGTLVALLAIVQGAPALAVVVALLWGAAVMADAGMFPALAVEHAAPEETSTVLTVQLAAGFALTAVATALVPLVQSQAGWPAALLMLAPGPLLGALAIHHVVDRRPNP